MSRLSGIDPFLFHVPETVVGLKRVKRVTRGITFESVQSGETPADWLPALVCLPSANFPFHPPPDFRVASRLGNVLSGRGSRAALTEIGSWEGVSVQLSRDGGTWELDTSVSTVKGHPVDGVGDITAEDRCIVGIIDAGLDPLHQAFLDSRGLTRIHYIWDQTAAGEGRKPSGLKPPFEQDYGAVYTAEDINRALAGAATLPTFGSEEAHRLHGTHVASIAAGRRAPGADGEPGFAGGMAPDAPIVVVIPALRAAPGQAPSEGFAKSHLDALRFIDAVADRLALPVVVNLSAGIAAGAHDGSSALEAGFDAFTKGGRAPGRAIVKSAGNARGDRNYRRFNLATTGRVRVDLRPQRPKGDATVEIWFSSAHDVEVTLKEAARLDSFTLSARAHQGMFPVAGATARLSYERYHCDNGDSQVLLTLPPTDAGYTLEFHGVAMHGRGEIDLWVDGPLLVERATEERTLTAPGAALTIITVASSDRNGQAIAESSSNGPTRDGRNKPELFAPGVEVSAARAGTRTGTVAKSGTSMAAPHVTGAVALLFSKQKRLGLRLPNALQARAALIATASTMDGNWQTDRGYGLLDARALLRAFDEPAPSPAPPADASRLGDTVPQK